MVYQKKWFSLIEVIIATSIITIAVFWVYKLIWENTKIISNSWNYIQVNSLFPALEECIENIWLDQLNSATWTEYDFNFWASLETCSTWITENIIIDNLKYNLKWIIKNSWTDFIDWELQINSDEVNTVTWSYMQIK